MESEHAVNVFKTYKQEENNFTNGLCSLLRLSIHERPRFIASFMKELLDLTIHGALDSRVRVRVLRGIQLADAELSGGSCCIRFETKVASGTLRHEQVRRHLRELDRRPGRLKRVVLLTPDDSESSYIKEFLFRYKPTVVHLGWRSVYDYLLEKSAAGNMSPLWAELVRQFLERIHERVFEQDMAGVITKIAFGEHAEVFPTTTAEHKGYLDLLLTDKRWNTPRPYKELDGKGRKLLLYDGIAGSITAEVEIKRVEHIPYERDFPSSNVFAGEPTIFPSPISLAHIRSIPGFENFGKYQKDRSPYRNITREQYRQLVGDTR